jgi:Pro-kumamolisin, activation domain
MKELEAGFQEIRCELPAVDSCSTAIPEVRQHAIMGFLLQDLFTYHSFSEPRGYRGDADLLDMAYLESNAAHGSPDVSALGREIFDYTSGVTATQAVRERKEVLTREIESLLHHVPHSRILSLACGHFRELRSINNNESPRFAEFVAFDQDPFSLKTVERHWARLGVRTMQGGGSSCFHNDVGRLDLIYAAGLYDYLQAPTAKSLTARLFAMLKPNGSILIANFLPDIWESGYMEAAMDWRHLQRRLAEIGAFLDETPASHIAKYEVWAASYGRIGYLLNKSTKNLECRLITKHSSIDGWGFVSTEIHLDSRQGDRYENEVHKRSVVPTGPLLLFIDSLARPGPIRKCRSASQGGQRAIHRAQHTSLCFNVSTAKNLGTEDPSETIEVSIWLNLHNRSVLDALAGDLYNPDSPNYRHWLSRADISAKFAPSAAEAKTVQKFLESHNLKIVTVGPDNFFVRARGTVGDVENAFHIQLNNYEVHGKTYRANTSDPYVEGPASALVKLVSGLDTGAFEHPQLLRPTSPPTAMTAATLSNASAASDPGFFQPVCFPGTETEKYTTDGTFPTASYTGNGYFSTGTGCGYTPSNVYRAYNLDGLYAEGYKGAGQTIVIIDWCGSPTIKQDANAFSKRFGLPQLTSSNFSIIQVPTPSSCAAADSEINLDVEWAHAIAPRANIDLVVPPSNSNQDIDEAWFYAVDYALGNVISGSYGGIESETSAAELEHENLIAEIGAISGISSNFSSGDGGDLSALGYPVGVITPADLPYATAIGGVSVALNSDSSLALQTGWGNNYTFLTDNGGIFDPPFAGGFNGGSGGGPSNCAIQDSSGNCLAGFPKPSFQKNLPGKYRQLPDISWVADPYTGVLILITEPYQFPPQVWLPTGGTSASCPMFSALWAIANEEAGSPLGQAAHYLYSMPSETITDVIPFGSTTNVTALVSESSSSTTFYNPAEVLGGALVGKFYSALWDDPYLPGTVVLSFGTDCSALPSGDGTPCTAAAALKTRVGWDNVTGVGTPNAQAFADFFHPAASKK